MNFRKLASSFLKVAVFVLVLFAFGLFLLNRDSELTLPISEYFPIAEYYPGSNYEHPDAKMKTKVRVYWPNSQAVFYTFRGPKLNEFAAIGIDGYALNAPNELLAKIMFPLISAIKKYSVTRNARWSLSKRESPVELGDREHIFRIMSNDSEIGTLITVRRGHVVYSYRILGAYLDGEQPWRTGILSRIVLIENL